MASKNPDKIREIEEVLGAVGFVDEIVRDLEWEDIEETGATLEENALLKAQAVVEATGLPGDRRRHRVGGGSVGWGAGGPHCAFLPVPMRPTRTTSIGCWLN